MSPEKEMFAPDTEVTLTATPASDYTFDHWEVEGNDSGSSATISLTMNSNTSIVAYFKAKDTTPPVISNVEIPKFSDIYATISWQTDEPATSQIEYGTTNAYGSNTPPDETLTTSHSVTLAELNSDTTYYFRVKSKDSSGNEATSEDQTFTTLGVVAVAAEVGPDVGKRAPDFTLPTVGGEELSLSSFRGKPVMVIFWVESLSSRTEMPLIQSFYEQWSDSELVILAVNWKQTKEQAQAFAENKGLTFPILLDIDGEIADNYDANPSFHSTTLFIDAQGIVKKRINRAFRNQTEIESIVKSL